MITHKVGNHVEGDLYDYFNFTNACDDDDIYPTVYQNIFDPHDPNQINCEQTVFPLCENVAVDWDSPSKDVICWHCNKGTIFDRTLNRCLYECPDSRPLGIVRGNRGTVGSILSNNVELPFYKELECIDECPNYHIPVYNEVIYECKKVDKEFYEQLFDYYGQCDRFD